jgi:hypothetical protein
MVIKGTHRLIFAGFAGTLVLAAILFGVPSHHLLGKILEGDELLTIQVESDFNRDGRISFTDFTFFAAFYEEAM